MPIVPLRPVRFGRTGPVTPGPGEPEGARESGESAGPADGRPRRERAAAKWAGAAALAVLTALTLLIVAVTRSDHGAARPEAPGRGTPGGGSASGAVAAALRSSVTEGQAAAEVEGLGGSAATGRRTPVPIASVTKVMTAYVVLRDHPLGSDEPGPVLTVDRTASDESGAGGESSVWVHEGQRLTERQALELMLIPSGNNVARLIARWDAGDQAAFVRKMNAAARSLGMTRTTYTEPSGIESATRSTAVDQLALEKRVMADTAFRSIVAEPSVTVRGGTGTVTTTNTLLGQDGVVGVKTGSSTPAGGALMWAAEADVHGTSRMLLGVVLDQNAGIDPEEGLSAALDTGRRLITALDRELGAGAPPQTRETTSCPAPSTPSRSAACPPANRPAPTTAPVCGGAAASSPCSPS